MSLEIPCATSKGIHTMVSDHESGQFAEGLVGVSVWVNCDCGQTVLVKAEVQREVVADIHQLRTVMDTLLDSLTAVHEIHKETR